MTEKGAKITTERGEILQVLKDTKKVMKQILEQQKEIVRCCHLAMEEESQ